MRRELLAGLGIALIVVGGGLYTVLSVNKGSHMVIEGSIQKVRTIGFDNTCAVVVDFRLHNPASFRYMVRSAQLIVDADGRFLEGQPVAEVDASRLFANYPILGQKYNETLKERASIAPGETVDRMVAVSFEVPEARIATRRALRLRIEEVDGLVTEIVEQGR